MSAKATTPEQAMAFHQAQIGSPQCFDGCCLHESIDRAEKAEGELEAMILYAGEVLHSMRGSDVLAFVHGMENDYTEANRLFRELPEDIRDRLVAAQLANA